MAARFRILNSELRGTELVLPRRPVILGRSSSNDLVVADPSISRQHVRVELKNGHAVLTDLGSHNGIVINEETLREAVVGDGGRFELGDVQFEFIAEPESETEMAMAPDAPDPDAPAAAPPATFDAFAPPPAAPSALPAERPVYIDDVFGAAVAQPQAGPGVQEKEAVASATGAIRFVVICVIMIGVLAFAWYIAGPRDPDVPVVAVTIKAGERRVIDLGLRTRTTGNGLVPYFDPNAVYSSFRYKRGDDSIVAFELDDKAPFMATIEGTGLGEVEITLLGSRGRRAKLVVLVRGQLPAQPGTERLTVQQRLVRGRELFQAARSAERNGRWYAAAEKCEQAASILRGAPTTEGIQLRRRADQLRRSARAKLDAKFEEVKLQAIAAMKSKDRAGAARAWEELRRSIPDPEDELNQKLSIILNRTLRRVQAGG
jgi:hypothetical protein